MSIGTLGKNVALSILGLAFIWFFAMSLPFHIADWDSGPFPFRMGAISLVGWIVMILGGCVLIWCYYLFILIGRGTPWPFDPPKKLIVVGPYRFVRNPMGVSFLMIILGEALVFGSVLLILYWLIGFTLLHFRTVLIEEPALRRRFGPSYERYFESVPRWIPQTRAYKEDN